jgi:hypothetical protein
LAWSRAGHENIGGFDVAVDDAFGMGGVERVDDLDTEIDQRLNFHGWP